MATNTFRDEAAVLRRLIGLTMARPGPSAYARLAESGALFALAATFFLLDQPPEEAAGRPVDPAGAEPAPVDVEHFAVFSLGRLLQHLSHKTEQLQVEYQGRVRGRVAWPATYKARYGQDYDPSRFVCREVRLRFDTPENQLVKYVVERIDACVMAVPEVMRAGMHIDPLAGDGGDAPRLRTVTRLGNIEAGLSRFRRNVYMREVTLPRLIDDACRLQATRAELDEYRVAVRVYDRYTDIVMHPTEAKITDIGRRVLPVPGETGPAAEAWLQLGAGILRSQAL